MSKTVCYFILLSLFIVLIIMISAALGAAQLSLAAVLKALVGGLPGLKSLLHGETVPLSHHLIVWDVRLPRILVALLVGASLGMAGAVFQGLLLNPLADPFTIGVSAGAAFGATVAIILQGVIVGLPLLHSFGIIPFFAFAGALLSLFFVYFIAKSEGRLLPESLILAGVIVASFLSALISFCKSIAGDNLSAIVFWIMGSLSGRLWQHVYILLPYFIVCFIIMQAHARHLNIIAMGDTTAMQLGVDVHQIRRRLLLFTSLLTAVAVSISGVIGFVGLVVPHINRLILGPNHRTLIPASALLGGGILILSDTLARTIAGSTEIPVGVVTALLGAPFFCYIFKKKFNGSR